jgi:hypothetical protein
VGAGDECAACHQVSDANVHASCKSKERAHIMRPPGEWCARLSRKKGSRRCAGVQFLPVDPLDPSRPPADSTAKTATLECRHHVHDSAGKRIATNRREVVPEPAAAVENPLLDHGEQLELSLDAFVRPLRMSSPQLAASAPSPPTVVGSAAFSTGLDFDAGYE